MEADEMLESEIQQKPEPDFNKNHIENDVNQEKQTDEILGSEVNSKPVETCMKTVMETVMNPEKQTDDIQGSEVNSEPVDTCQETVIETDVNPGKQADPKSVPEVDQKPSEICQETAGETDVTPEKQIADPGVIYRCRRCRQMVATQEYVVTHNVGRGAGNYGARKKSHVDEDDKKPECSLCIFVEPMKWMKAGRFLVHDSLFSLLFFSFHCIHH
jgi:dual specificity phosphatase 12